MKKLVSISLLLIFAMLSSNAQPVNYQDLKKINIDLQRDASIDCNDPSTWPSDKEARKKTKEDCKKKLNIDQATAGPKIGDACNCHPRDFIRKYIFTIEEFSNFELFDKNGKPVQGIITKTQRGKVLIKLDKISNLANLTMKVTTKSSNGSLSSIEMPIPLKNSMQ